jgi:hypothetical protein
LDLLLLEWKLWDLFDAGSEAFDGEEVRGWVV